MRRPVRARHPCPEQDAARSAAPARPRGSIDMTRTVHCQYENKDAEGLDFVPWPGELGKRVFANVGKAGWAAWLAHQTMLHNEHRLSPVDTQHGALDRESDAAGQGGNGSVDLGCRR